MNAVIQEATSAVLETIQKRRSVRCSRPRLCIVSRGRLSLSRTAGCYSGFPTVLSRSRRRNLMLAACELGLGTCCIGFAVPVLNTADVKQELGIPADVTAVAPIIVGVPSDDTAPIPRKAPDVLRWIQAAVR